MRDDGPRTSADGAGSSPDSLVEEAVSSEPVSGREFPVKQGKYREFSRFSPDLLEIYLRNHVDSVT